LTSSCWDVIFNSGNAQTVLGIDFPDGKRREAGFAELAARIGLRYRFLQARPVTVRSDRRVSANEYIVPWVEGARQDGHPMRAVLGHRVGGIYAAAIAERISQWQSEPRVILLDPQFVTSKFMGLELHKEISATSSLLSDDEIRRARKIASEISELRPEGVVRAAADAVESYLGVVTAAFERAGLGDPCGSKLSEYFESYMTWLSVAVELDPGHALRKSTVIISCDYTELPGRLYFDDFGAPAARCIMCDVSHVDLLRSHSVAKEILDLLESH
jgi:hypothetical protein